MILDLATNFISYVLPFLLVLTILVFVHEMGHYLVARWNGVRIEVFSIGFGGELKGWNDKSGTRWKICWIPFGGYVKFFGDTDSASRPNEKILDELGESDKRVSFHHKTLGQRAAIVVAGPMANFIYAIIVLAAIYMFYGQRVTPPEIGRVVEQGEGRVAGFREGDIVLAIDDNSIYRFEEFQQKIFMNPGKKLTVRIRRAGRNQTLEATPRLVQKTDKQGITHKFGDLGLWPANPAIVGNVVKGGPAAVAGIRAGDRIIGIDGTHVDNFERLQDKVLASKGRRLTIAILRNGEKLNLYITARKGVGTKKPDTKERWLIGIFRAPRPLVRHSPGESVLEALVTCYDMLEQTLVYVGEMLTGRRGTEDLGGPLRIAHASGQAAQVGIEQLIMLSVLLSLNLGIINLFPIPILDGGHLLFYGFEAILRRPLTIKIQEFCFRIGLAMVLSLTLFVTWNDLVQLRVVQFITELFL